MLQKILVVFGVMMILVLAFASVASADTVSGYGWLKATGAGTATLHMTGEVNIEGHGAGVITVRGAEVVHAEGKGRRTDLPDGSVILRGFQGRVHIVGKNMTVRIVGGKIDFTAHGFGTVTLKGHGHYETRHGRGTWGVNGIDVAIEE